jgi:putative pre-16S rRNA nuclease
LIRSESGRVLGIDLGDRRIGVALGDPTGTIAQPLPTLKKRAGKRMPVQAVVELVRKHHARAVVLGLPLAPSGEETDWCRAVRAFGDQVSGRAGVDVHYIDERYTSARAERAVREMGLPRRKRAEKDRIDAGAAVLILQAWLDRESRS